jgi:predicted PurR-regulated permease PerM
MDRQRRAIAWVALGFAALTLVLLHPILLPLVLGAWFARLARPLRDRLPLKRRLAAALLTLLLVVGIAAPVGLLYKFLGDGAMGLASALVSSQGPKAALVSLVQPGEQKPTLDSVQKLLEQHSANTPAVARFGALFVLGTVLFFFFLGLSSFGLLSDGEALYAWLREHQPLRAEHFDRLGGAFSETGRGLLTYVALTCLSQGILCTLTYVALGIPRALVLGFISAVFAVLPVVGTPLVWIPVALGLFLVGSTTKALILLVVGSAVIAAVENVIGPLFARLASCGSMAACCCSGCSAACSASVPAGCSSGRWCCGSGRRPWTARARSASWARRPRLSGCRAPRSPS